MSMQFLVLPEGVYLSMPEDGNAILRSSVQAASDRHLNIFVFNFSTRMLVKKLSLGHQNDTITKCSVFTSNQYIFKGPIASALHAGKLGSVLIGTHQKIKIGVTSSKLDIQL